ncbi:MFS transporter [Pseudotabrizicola sediminis]|uniref:MFS transporter n=1 Tax=Pseudotabrizicola sediminis TaxID=2486418 RepID=A0ABY2KHC6_9RHOB|nr:MFS transporter [Pseudotabrizicola sediminis]TGD41682.1 MFS transporter [Pseudotabrizicola sediminis]
MVNFLIFLRINASWLAAGFLLTFTSSFGQTFFISVFSGDIRAEFGLSNGEWGGIYTLATMASAVVMVFAGGLTDRFRVRHIGVIILGILAFAVFLMAQAGSVWVLVLAMFLLRLMGQGMMGHTAMVAMARWFVATRGRAVSIAGLGVAMGEGLLPITFVALMGVFAWRDLWIGAGLFLLLMTPVLFVLLRRERTPMSFAKETHSAGMQGRSWTRGEVSRHWLFWMMVPALLGPAAWSTAFFFHQVHFAEVKGWSHVSLVALFPMFTLTGIITMLSTGWLVDRFGCARLASVYLLPFAAGFGVIAVADALWVAGLGVILMGVGQGMNSTLSTAFWAEFFGTRHLGTIRAMTAAIMVLGTAIGPGVSGVLIDLGIAFPSQAYGIGIYFLVAGILAGIGALRARLLLRALPDEAPSKRTS